MLDLVMPEMDGFEFLAELRGRPDAHDIPVVVVTARDLTAADRERLNGGVERIIAKRGYAGEDLLREVGRAREACVHSRQRGWPGAPPALITRRSSGAPADAEVVSTWPGTAPVLRR